MKSHRTDPSNPTHVGGHKRRFDRTLVLGTFSVIAVSALPFGCGGTSEEGTSDDAGRGGSDVFHGDASQRGGSGGTGGTGGRKTTYGDGSASPRGGSGGHIAWDGFNIGDGRASGDGYRGDGRYGDGVQGDGYAVGGGGNRGGASSIGGNVHSDAGLIPSDGYDGGDGEGWSDGVGYQSDGVSSDGAWSDGVGNQGDGEGASARELDGADDDPAFKAEPGDGPDL